MQKPPPRERERGVHVEIGLQFRAKNQRTYSNLESNSVDRKVFQKSCRMSN